MKLAEYIKRLDSTFEQPDELLKPVEANLLRDIPLCLRGAFLLDTIIRPLVLFSELSIATEATCEAIDSPVAYLNEILVRLGFKERTLQSITHLQKVTESELGEMSGWYEIMEPDNTRRSTVKRKLDKSQAIRTFISNIANLLSIISDALKNGHIDAIKGYILFYAANLKWHIISKKKDDMLFSAIALGSLPIFENECVDRSFACGEEIVKTRWIAVLDIIEKQNATIEMSSIWDALVESKTVQAFLDEVPFLSKLNDLQKRFQNEFLEHPYCYPSYLIERELPKCANIHNRFIEDALMNIPDLNRNPFIGFNFVENDLRKQKVSRMKGKTKQMTKESEELHRFGCPLKIFDSRLGDVNKQFRSLIKSAQSPKNEAPPDYTNLRELLCPLSIKIRGLSDLQMMIKCAFLIDYLHDFPLRAPLCLPTKEILGSIVSSALHFIDELAIASVFVEDQEQLRDYLFQLNNPMQKYIPDKDTTIKLLTAFGDHLQAISLRFDDKLFSRGKLKTPSVDFNRYITSSTTIFNTVPKQIKRIICKEIIECYWKIINEQDAEAYGDNELLTEEYLQKLHPQKLNKLKIPDEVIWKLAKKEGGNQKLKELLKEEIIPSIEFVYSNIPSQTMIRKLVKCCTSYVLSSIDSKEYIDRISLNRLITCMFISSNLIENAFEKEEIVLDKMSRALFISDYLGYTKWYRIPGSIRKKIRLHQEDKEFDMLSIEHFFDIDNEFKFVVNRNLFQWRLFFRNICEKYSSESMYKQNPEYYSNNCSGNDSSQNDARMNCFKEFLSKIKEIKVEELRESLQYVGLSINLLE